MKNPSQTLLSKNEIIKTMEANMRLQMVYFAEHLSVINILSQPDVTIVYSSMPDDTFNYVLDAKFEKQNVQERVAFVLNFYREHKIPFSWWVGETDTPDSLVQELVNQGLSMKEDDIGMYLSVQEYNGQTDPTDVSIKRVLNQNDLLDFAKVYTAIGGYKNVYEDLYSKIPDSLIAEGGPYEMYVGYLDGQPVLTGILVLHADVAGIYYVMTVPERRRKGYGTYMMRFLIDRARERGAPLVTLQASADGRGLYEKLGFKSICRFVEYA